jgi:hypothetical protein
MPRCAAPAHISSGSCPAGEAVYTTLRCTSRRHISARVAKVASAAWADVHPLLPSWCWHTNHATHAADNSDGTTTCVSVERQTANCPHALIWVPIRSIHTVRSSTSPSRSMPAHASGQACAGGGAPSCKVRSQAERHRSPVATPPTPGCTRAQMGPCAAAPAPLEGNACGKDC